MMMQQHPCGASSFSEMDLFFENTLHKALFFFFGAGEGNGTFSFIISSTSACCSSSSSPSIYSSSSNPSSLLLFLSVAILAGTFKIFFLTLLSLLLKVITALNFIGGSSNFEQMYFMEYAVGAGLASLGTTLEAR